MTIGIDESVSDALVSDAFGEHRKRKPVRTHSGNTTAFPEIRLTVFPIVSNL